MPQNPQGGACAHQGFLVAMAMKEGFLLFRGLEFQVEFTLIVQALQKFLEHVGILREAFGRIARH